jgi:hypothetical protein
MPINDAPGRGGSASPITASRGDAAVARDDSGTDELACRLEPPPRAGVCVDTGCDEPPRTAGPEEMRGLVIFVSP